MRFGFALAASLVLHLAMLLPAEWWLPSVPVPNRPPLAVTLPPPASVREMATQPEKPPAAETAVLPAPTTSPQPSPKPLTGKALSTAMAALTREEFYPREAIVHEIQGRVVLLLTLDAVGRVTAVEVASGSGHDILDKAAIKAASRIGSLPGGRRQVLLPVEFRLE